MQTEMQMETMGKTINQVVELEFLFLDLNTCTRCVGTNENLETAIHSVKDILALTNTELMVEKVLIENEAQALAHQFVTSPTIRINGRDIALEMRESQCDSCTEICGCAEGTDCREWVYQGEVFMEAPVGMIVEAILGEIFNHTVSATAVPTTTVPDNLRNFFAHSAAAETAGHTACCSESKQQTCCEPTAKADCCGSTSESGHCGCQ